MLRDVCVRRSRFHPGVSLAMWVFALLCSVSLLLSQAVLSPVVSLHAAPMARHTRTASQQVRGQKAAAMSASHLAGTHAAAGSGTSSVVTAYWGDDANKWSQLEQTHPSGTIAIANFEAGAPGGGDAAFTNILQQAHSAGLKVIGYVATGYGSNHSLSEIEHGIDGWYAYGIDGIFEDEGQCDDSHLSFYQSIADYIRSKNGGGHLIVVNPGFIPTTSSYLNAADIIMAYEGGADNYSLNPPGWMSDPAHFAAIIEGAGSDQLQSLIQKSEQYHIGYTFMIPDSQDYGQLPSYWSQEASLLGGLAAPPTGGQPAPSPGQPGQPGQPTQPGGVSNPVQWTIQYLITQMAVQAAQLAQGLIAVMLAVMNVLFGQITQLIVNFESATSFLWRTPPEMTYENISLQGIWSGSMTVAAGLYVLALMWNGILLMWRQSSVDYAEAIGIIPQAFLAFFLAAFSMDLMRLLINLNNALCHDLAKPELGLKALDANNLLLALTMLIYGCMGLLLFIMNVVRLGLLCVEIAIAPLCCLCLATKATEPIGRLWFSVTIATIFVQFLQSLALSIGLSYLAPLVTSALPPNLALVSPLTGIAILYLVLQIPKWLQQAALASMHEAGESFRGAIGGAARATVVVGRAIAGAAGA